MKWIFKAGLLVTLLAIPVLIYLFLQIFGQNYYSLPIYYQDSPATPENCDNSLDASQVDWSNQEKLASNLVDNKLTVFAVISENCDQECQIKFNQVNRLANNFIDQDSLQIAVIIINDQQNDSSDWDSDQDNLKFINLEKQLWQQFSRCELLLEYSDLTDTEPENQFVLLDGIGRIRGYYNGLSLEDIDRLITEIRLLLYEYQHQT